MLKCSCQIRTKTIKHLSVDRQKSPCQIRTKKLTLRASIIHLKDRLTVKQILLSTIVLALLIAGMYFGYKWLSEDNGQVFVGKEKSHALTAIPIQSPFILSIDRLSDFAEDLVDNDNATLSIRSFSPFKPVFSLLQTIASIEDLDISKIFTEPIFVSASFISRKESSYLIATSMTPKNAENFGDVLASLFPETKSTHIRNYMGANMRKAVIKSVNTEAKNIYYSYTRGLILICDNELMLEASIRQSKERGLFDDPTFEKIFSFSNTDKNTTLFINFAHATQYIDKFSNTDKEFWHKQLSDKLSFLSNYGTWGELELKLTNDDIALKGLAVSNNDGSKFVDAFKNQSSTGGSPSKITPDNCACFISLNLSDISSYQTDYRTYLKINSAKFNTYEHTASIISQNSGLNIKELFSNTLTGEITQSFYINESPHLRPRTVFAAKLKDKDSYARWLSFASNYKNDTSYTHNTTDIKTDKGTKYSLISNPDTSIISVLLGPIFTVTNTKYFTRLNDYICFFESVSDAKEFISSIEGGRTLSNSANYSEIKDRTEKYNLLLYLNNTYGLFSSFLNSDIANIIQDKGANLASKYRYFTWQMFADDKVCHNSLHLMHTPKANTEAAPEWTRTLSSPFSARPLYAHNHTHISTKDIAYLDEKNTLHYIDKMGKEEWTKELDGKLIGDIHQIDYYGNNKWQIIVLTEKSIDLIDRLGNSVKGFPKKITAAPASGLSVFDYDNKKDYRIFYTSKDGKILLFDKDMKQIKEWIFDGKIKGFYQDIQHFSKNNKDYLVAASNDKLHILNRRGATRVETPNDIKYSDNIPCIVESEVYATSENGDIIKHKLNGTIEKLTVGKFSKEHYFTALENINMETVFIITEGRVLKIFNAKGEQIKQEKYKNELISRPRVYRLKDNRKIISFATKDNKIHIINPDGQEISGSPFIGLKHYNIDYIDSKQSDSYLITSSENAKITMYRIQN